VENGSTITLKEYVTTYADPTSSREVEPGDVYVDNVTKAIYVYWNANEIGKGWWRMGYYSGAPADGTEDAINEGLTYGSPNN
jgi:hypothetical protein